MKIAHSSSLWAIKRGSERKREGKEVRELEMPFLRYLRTFTASLLHLHLLFPPLPRTSSSSPSSAFMIFLLASFANFRSSNFRGKNYVFQSDFKVIGRWQRGEERGRGREGIEVNRSHAPIPKKRFEIAPNGGTGAYRQLKPTWLEFNLD